MGIGSGGMGLGAWLLVGALIAATVFGLWFQRANGRIKDAGPAARRATETRGVHVVGPDDPPAEIEADADETPAAAALRQALDGRLGERATVVQFSSAFCQPCRATRRILEEVTAMVPGVQHIELDAEDHLDLVAMLDIRRTPTVLFLDRAGTVRKHASGQPRKADVIAALGELLPGTVTDFEI